MHISKTKLPYSALPKSTSNTHTIPNMTEDALPDDSGVDMVVFKTNSMLKV